jgi:ABC-2 type transport system permease protein
MTRVLLKKCIHESKWLWLGCATVMFAFCWLFVWITGQVDTGSIETILDMIPNDWQRFTPVDVGWFVTQTGRISIVYDHLIVVMCLSIWAIARGSDCVSGEIGRGTMELLLAQPLGRVRLMLAQATVTVAGVLLLAATSWIGLYVGIETSSAREEVAPAWELPVPLPLVGRELPNPFAEKEVRYVPMSQRVSAEVFVVGAVNLAALGVMLAGFSTLASSLDRYRWRSIGIIGGAFIVQVIIKIAGMASDDLSGLLFLSVLTAYEPEAFVRLAEQSPDVVWHFFLYDEHGNWLDYGPLWHNSLLVVVGLISYVTAGVMFYRRDIPAPL